MSQPNHVFYGKWIIGSLNSNGTIEIDGGAAKALLSGKSLLAAGVNKINGSFEKGENVLILDQNNNQLEPEVLTRKIEQSTSNT